MRERLVMNFVSVALFCFFITLGFGCSHTLEIKNLQEFTVPLSIDEPERKINLGIKSYNGNSDLIWYSNAILEELSSRREFGKFQTNYVDGRSSFNPDYIIYIEPHTNYASSAWNFLVNFPGGIIFSPAWHGYSYYANITTNVTISGGDGKELKRFIIDTPYSIRHSEFDRTWWPVFSFNIWNWIGGIYTANVYDTDITPAVRDAIKTNYSKYVTDRILKELKGQPLLGGN